MPARRAWNSDGSPGFGSRKRWSGQWLGTALGEEMTISRRSRGSKSIRMSTRVIADVVFYATGRLRPGTAPCREVNTGQDLHPRCRRNSRERPSNLEGPNTLAYASGTAWNLLTKTRDRAALLLWGSEHNSCSSGLVGSSSPRLHGHGAQSIFSFPVWLGKKHWSQLRFLHFILLTFWRMQSRRS